MDKRFIKSADETLYTYTHSSGAKIYMVQKKGSSKSAAYFTTHFGSIDNCFIPFGETEYIYVPDGVAHFLEHKMFEMPDESNIFDLFSKYGASANAYTSFNMTSYYFWCTDYFKENLKTLVTFVQTPHFTEENVAKEQGIIGQEIRMYDDAPTWRCYFNMLSCMYEKNPVSRDIAGTVESISEIDKDVLYKCYNTFYHPSNMTLCLVGDFDPEDMKNYLDEILKPLPNEDDIKRKSETDGAAVICREKCAEMSVSRPIYAIGFKDNFCSGNILKRRVAVQIALNLLIGKSSCLYNELYESGHISPEFGFDYTGEESYAFTEIADECDNPSYVADKIKAAIQSFKVSDEDFERIRRKLFGKKLYAFNDPDNYAGALARNTVLGLDMYETLDLFKTVTRADVEDVFKTHLSEENMVISIVNPLH
ncbi:MAG: insulinase family protein [Clostridia bacterium]|nr:insulinase family protein [Clostridia bacterium]